MSSQSLRSDAARAGLAAQAAIDKGLSVVVVASMAHCVPCRLLAPLVAHLAGLHAGAVQVVHVDAGDDGDFVARHGIEAFPTLLAFRAGEPAGRKQGYGGPDSAGEIEAVFTAALPDGADRRTVGADFRARLVAATALFDSIMDPPSRALEPHIGAANAAIDTAREALRSRIAAGEIDEAQASRLHREAIAEAYAPFRHLVDALRAAQEEALLAFERATGAPAGDPGSAVARDCDGDSCALAPRSLA